MAAEEIRIAGLVQGVGFRPAVYRLAVERRLRGTVHNDGQGVLIRVGGLAADIEDFVRALQAEAPPLARIDRLERVSYLGILDEGFRIVESEGGPVRTAVVPDAATCDACLAELRDPHNRRFRYPFINCTHCGPRLSIVRAIPYDRANTSMAIFTMCADCAREYHDPADRRFHAQPNACQVCGPQPWLEDAGGGVLAPDAPGQDPIEAAVARIRAGEIVAIKGLGGFHLACDALNDAAVDRLRARKRRYEKPFALMARDMAVMRRFCLVDEAEQHCLSSVAAPIVLLSLRPGARVASAVAPGLAAYGFMLPYTPLHHRLMAALEGPIVLTSGNRSDEPQCIGDDEARTRLSEIADYFVRHEREIVNRVDDSLVRVVAGRPRLLRRARGYAPAPLRLPPGFETAPPALAYGGELKSTFCLLREGDAILSQHLGDLENATTCAAYQDMLALYARLFEHKPQLVAVDLHPDYFSSRFGRQHAEREGLRLIEVQHHHAHIAACLAENGVPPGAPPVLGVALDGLGFGADATLWGGEFLVATYAESRRAGCFERVRMPGGAQAIREPWRMAYAYLHAREDRDALLRRYGDLPFVRSLRMRPLEMLNVMMARGINSPYTSSCGRLFDAVAALAGLRESVTYEGQAACELEAVVDPVAFARNEAYPFDSGQVAANGLALIGTGPLWPALLEDLARATAPGVIAARFHNGLIDAVVTMVDRLSVHFSETCGCIALSGGVFQNALLAAHLPARLRRRGFTVYEHANVPANDGGLALGQVAVAAVHAL